VRLDGQFLQDSPAIVTALLQQLKTRGAISQQTLDSFASPEALKWGTYCSCSTQYTYTMITTRDSRQWIVAIASKHVYFCLPPLELATVLLI
jgi:hypothetical protein